MGKLIAYYLARVEESIKDDLVWYTPEPGLVRAF